MIKPPSISLFRKVYLGLFLLWKITLFSPQSRGSWRKETECSYVPEKKHVVFIKRQ
jgi:hypothetical protein